LRRFNLRIGPDPSTEQLANIINAMESDPNAVPGACDAPMAIHMMMVGIQEDVGNRIADQLVDLRDFQTISLKPGNWSCRVTTVWGQHPAVRGVFHAYKNAMGNRVYSWNGEREVTIAP
jgi:hypothetical protein